jgi:hypothetical protein
MFDVGVVDDDVDERTRGDFVDTENSVDAACRITSEP